MAINIFAFQGFIIFAFSAFSLLFSVDCPLGYLDTVRMIRVMTFATLKIQSNPDNLNLEGK